MASRSSEQAYPDLSSVQDRPTASVLRLLFDRINALQGRVGDHPTFRQDLVLSNKRITALADPQQDADAVNLRYLRANFGAAALRIELQVGGSAPLSLVGLPGVDLGSSLPGNPITLTGTASATIDRMHYLTGTSADYTVTLPPVLGNNAHHLAFAGGLVADFSRFVTLDGSGTETIGNALSRVVWAGESVLLECDEARSNWKKIGGLTIPMAASFERVAAQSVPTGALTKILLDTQNWSYGNLTDVANSRLVVSRPGRYLASVYGRFDVVAATSAVVAVFVNSAEVCRAETTTAIVQAAATGQPIDVAAADLVELYMYQDSGINQSTNAAATARPRLVLQEVPSW